MGFKKIPNGQYYYFGKDGCTEKMIRLHGKNNGYLYIGTTTFPKELVGKKVRITLEIVKKE